MEPSIIAIDLAKNVFEIAIADKHGKLLTQQRLSRRRFQRFVDTLPPGHIVMEACGSAHHWGRVLLQRGHRVSLLPPHYVRPYVRRHKTDRSDAEALLEAARCGRIPPVPVKTIGQQEIVALHRVRSQWVAARTARINAMRGFLQEYGLVIPRGARTALKAIPEIVDGSESPLPFRLRQALLLFLGEVRDLERRIQAAEQLLHDVAISDPVVPRLLQIPGIGLLTATALVGSVGNIQAFPRARHFASWVGLTPREHSSGDHRRLGHITKHGDVYLRCLLVHGARAVLRAARKRVAAGEPITRLQQWAIALQVRRGNNKTIIALANKLARAVWAVWKKEEDFNPTPVPMAV